MMCQRNVELQLQALELIERKFGKTPQSYVPHEVEEIDAKNAKETPKIHVKSPIEDKVMEEVVK